MLEGDLEVVHLIFHIIKDFYKVLENCHATLTLTLTLIVVIGQPYWFQTNQISIT